MRVTSAMRRTDAAGAIAARFRGQKAGEPRAAGGPTTAATRSAIGLWLAVATLGVATACRDAPRAESTHAVAMATETAAVQLRAPDASAKDETRAVTGDAAAPNSLPDAMAADRAPARVRKGVQGTCPGLAYRKAHFGISRADLDSAWVDGDDLLALVNRTPTGSLAPDYVPSDLVELATKQPPKSERRCESALCLRRDAAGALDELLAKMTELGFPGHVESAYRSYGNQCATFQNWAGKSDFCRAAEQSAIPGHSQHQLGTTVDLFTAAWARDARGVFRDGFGCTKAGKWLAEHTVEFGFVMSYPLYPDHVRVKDDCAPRTDIRVGVNPLTGYRYERWHFRYIGKAEAQRFIGYKEKHGERVTLEQWIRSEKGLAGAESELPVCDGCNCRACASLAMEGEGACGGARLSLDEKGAIVYPNVAPVLIGARVDAKGGKMTLIARVRTRASAPTQPSARQDQLGTYRVAVRTHGDTMFRVFVSLADLRETAEYDTTSVVLPSRVGEFDVRAVLPAGMLPPYDVAIVRDQTTVGDLLEAQ